MISSYGYDKVKHERYGRLKQVITRYAQAARYLSRGQSAKRSCLCFDSTRRQLLLHILSA